MLRRLSALVRRRLPRGRVEPVDPKSGRAMLVFLSERVVRAPGFEPPLVVRINRRNVAEWCRPPRSPQFSRYRPRARKMWKSLVNFIQEYGGRVSARYGVEEPEKREFKVVMTRYSEEEVTVSLQEIKYTDFLATIAPRFGLRLAEPNHLPGTGDPNHR